MDAIRWNLLACCNTFSLPSFRVWDSSLCSVFSAVWSKNHIFIQSDELKAVFEALYGWRPANHKAVKFHVIFFSWALSEVSCRRCKECLINLLPGLYWSNLLVKSCAKCLMRLHVLIQNSWCLVGKILTHSRLSKAS